MTDVKLVKDCGLYPSYKKIIDFTGTKSEIINKQLAWIDTFEHIDILNVNYNKAQNKLTLPIDYEEALTYTYVVLTNIVGTGEMPQFFFIGDVSNLTNGIDNAEPNVAITLSLDPIMTFMGNWKVEECMVVREHVDRWNDNSSKPSRVTPNIEGSYGFTEYLDSIECKMIDRDGVNCVLIMLSVITAEGSIHYYGFPVSNSLKFNTTTEYVYINGTTYQLPNLYDIASGDIIDDFGLAPTNVVNVSVYSMFSEKFIVESYTPSPGAVTIRYTPIPIRSAIVSQSSHLAMIDFSTEYNDVFMTEPKVIEIELPASIKPSSSDDRSDIYEPMMFTDPFIKYTLNDGVNDLFDIPDNVILKSNGTLELKIKTQLSCSVPGALVYIGNTIDEAIGNNCITFVSASQVDIGNDLWQEYSVTAKDTDRQMVINNSIKSAIDNLVFMSYGGALVGSRSSTAKKLANPMFGQGAYSGVRFYNGGDMGAIYPWEHTKDYPGRFAMNITPTGKRLMGAVGLAAGASVISSIVDGAIAWENQKLYEQQIKNKPSGLLQGGASLSRITSGNAFCQIIIRKLDKINYDIGYERYWKYGYIVNKNELPNLRSRKYFNYIYTQGAIISGSLNQVLREAIATVFDNGVTIFHYDSGDTKVRKLEYPDKENIETVLTPIGQKTYTFPALNNNHTIRAEMRHV